MLLYEENDFLHRKIQENLLTNVRASKSFTEVPDVSSASEFSSVLMYGRDPLLECSIKL